MVYMQHTQHPGHDETKGRTNARSAAGAQSPGKLGLCRVWVLAILAIGCFASAAIAGPKCRSNDAWKGPDKNLHAGVGAFAALAATGATGSPLKGWAYTTGAALAWELAPLVTKRGDCSLQDLLVSSAGAALGASVGGLSLRYGRGEVQIGYVRQF